MYYVRKSKIWGRVCHPSHNPQCVGMPHLRLPMYYIVSDIGFASVPWCGSTNLKYMKKLAKIYAPRIRHLYE